MAVAVTLAIEAGRRGSSSADGAAADQASVRLRLRQEAAGLVADYLSEIEEATVQEEIEAFVSALRGS